MADSDGGDDDFLPFVGQDCIVRDSRRNFDCSGGRAKAIWIQIRVPELLSEVTATVSHDPSIIPHLSRVSPREWKVLRMVDT